MIFVLNWKMHPETAAEAKALIASTRAIAAKARKDTFFVAPPAVFLPLVASGRGSVSFAAQNAHFETVGAHTGDVSARQARSVGASAALVGHAERRALGESDEDVRKKVNSILAEGMTAIICVGEQTRDHGGEYFEVLKRQCATALGDVDKKNLKRAVMAYEPVWAIGAPSPMAPAQMHEMVIFIRKILWEKFGKPGLTVPILYGGAILSGESAAALAEESGVSGFLLGRASTDPAELAHIVKACAAL